MAPMRLLQTCLADTAPLTGCNAAGCGLLGPVKVDKTEQPDKDAIKIVAACARKIRARGLNDG